MARRHHGRQVGGLRTEGSHVLALMDLLILGAMILVALEAVSALRRARADG